MNTINKSPKRSAYCFAPLLGFELDCDNVKTREGINIRLPNSKENNLINEFSSYFGQRAFRDWKYVLCTQTASIPCERHSEIPLIRVLFNTSKVLKLLKRGWFCLGPQFAVDGDNTNYISSGSSSRIAIFSGREPYILLAAELPSFEELMKQFYGFDFSKNKRLMNAIFRFDKSYEEALDQIPIDLMIAFEALYLAEEQELGFKLGTRAAYLLADTAEHRKYVHHMLKLAYKVRSSLVHGSDWPSKLSINSEKEMEKYEFVSETQEVLRQSIKKFITLLTRYSHKELLSNLLDDNIMDGGQLLRI